MNLAQINDQRHQTSQFLNSQPIGYFSGSGSEESFPNSDNYSVQSVESQTPSTHLIGNYYNPMPISPTSSGNVSEEDTHGLTEIINNSKRKTKVIERHTSSISLDRNYNPQKKVMSLERIALLKKIRDRDARA